MIFSEIIIEWYLKNKRELPWRNTQNPYKIWLSEIILQQTRVAQGLPYYLAFTESFPTVEDLANASEQEVLKLWQGLGYYSRARNLHTAAKHITFDLGSKFPNSYKDLLKLKGVGEYTAAAVASFSYNEPVPVVDGNVFRVLARVFNVKSDISASKSRKEFFELSQSLLPKNTGSLYNQAIMEFGALQCMPQNPNCNTCAMNPICLAYKYDTVKSLPVKSKKIKVKDRHFNYAVVIDQSNNILHQKRNNKDIWQHLYEFLLIETDTEVETKHLIELLLEKNIFRNNIIEIIEKQSDSIIHKLSHQKLHIKYVVIKVENTLSEGITIDEFMKLPVPIPIELFINSEFK